MGAAATRLLMHAPPFPSADLLWIYSIWTWDSWPKVRFSLVLTILKASLTSLHPARLETYDDFLVYVSFSPDS